LFNVKIYFYRYIAAQAKQGIGLVPPSQQNSTNQDTNVVLGGNVQLLETVLMPAIKAGVRSNSIATRKTFILLLSYISEQFEWMDIDDR